MLIGEDCVKKSNFSCDLDFELDLVSQMMYLHTKNEVSMLRLSQVEYTRTDRSLVLNL